MMSRSIIIAITALFAVVAASSWQGLSVSQADDSEPKREKKISSKPADFDGESIATCDHPVDRESKKVKVNRKFVSSDGTVKEKTVDGVLTEEVGLIDGSCGTASGESGFVAMATSTTATCYGKLELNTLLGNEAVLGVNWRLQGWQTYRTYPYYGNLYWPPYTPIIDADANLGWSTKSEKITGPEKWSLINGAVYKGATTFQATFVYKIGALGFDVVIDTDSPAFRLIYGYRYCSKKTLSSS